MSTATTPAQLVRDLRDICGAEHVTEDAANLDVTRVLGATPAITVEPASAEEVAAILRIANHQGLNVVPAGGLTQQQSGALPNPIDVLLCTSRLSAVEHYDPADLTVGLSAGCKVAQLASMVEKDGLLFAADVAMPEQATIGGMLATGMTGPLRHGYGGLRDYCIGVRFVTGDGRKGKGGGRVVKNVAGFDLMKLLIGSRGTLAIITGASFKLFPAPRQTKTFVAEFAESAEAIQFRDAVLRSPLSPICLELISPGAANLLTGTLNNDLSSRAERSGAAGSAVRREAEGAGSFAPGEMGWSVCVRASGSDAVLARYRAELGTAISKEVDSVAEAELWQALQNFPHTTALQRPESLLIAFSLPAADVQAALNDFEATGAANDLALAVIGRVGVGHLLAALWPKTGQQAAFGAVLLNLRNRLPRDASMSVLYCPESSRHEIATLQKTPTHLESMRAVKRTLDPKNVLNRGRFVL